jgi:predicted nucleic acid-binding protein
VRFPRPRLVFVDASAFVALVSPRDQHHRQAGIILARLRRDHWRLFTSNLILAETHAWLLSHLGRRMALDWLRGIRASASTTILRVAAGDEDAAIRLLERYDDKDFSLVDATSFVLMRRHGIDAAFSFDHHFAQYGATVLE